MKNPLLNLQQKIKKNKKIYSLLVTNSSNLNYLTDSTLFSSTERDGIALITPKKSFLFVSPLIYEQTKKIINYQSLTINHQLQIVPLKTKNTLYSHIKSFINNKRPTGLHNNFNLGFEENDLNFAEYNQLKKKIKVKLIPTKNIVENLRTVKTNEEIKKIKQAVSITKKAFQYIKTQLKPGKTEKQIAWQMEKFFKQKGVNLAFPIIIASGPNSSIPHYKTGKRKLEKNDICLIDAGVKYQGYCSDMTRTFFLGKAKPEWKKVYQIVKTSQKKALQYVKAKPLHTLKSNQLDKIAREYIKSKGYKKYFIHNLGHGLGLDIHEKPYISPKSKQTLKPSMIFTIEPGIYLPKKFGIRIEDTIILKN